MQTVDYDRAVRCIAAIIYNEDSIDVFAPFLSNLFDIEVHCVGQDIYNARAAYLKHRMNGGRIRDFEDGKICTSEEKK